MLFCEWVIELPCGQNFQKIVGSHQNLCTCSHWREFLLCAGFKWSSRTGSHKSLHTYSSSWWFHKLYQFLGSKVKVIYGIPWNTCEQVSDKSTDLSYQTCILVSHSGFLNNSLFSGPGVYVQSFWMDIFIWVMISSMMI